MRQDCINAVSDAIGRTLKVGEAKNIEERINKWMRQLAQKDRFAWQKLTQGQRLEEAAKSAAAEIAVEAAVKRRNIALDIIANSKLRANGGDTFAGIDQLIAHDSKSARNVHGVQSVATRADAIFKLQGIAPLNEEFEKMGNKFFGLIVNKKGVTNLLRELHGIDTGDATARTAATKWADVTENLRQLFNSFGGVIGKLEDWKHPQSHNQYLVLKAKQVLSKVKTEIHEENKAAWVDFIMPLLDRNKYVDEAGQLFDDAKMRDFLGHAWESIAHGGALKEKNPFAKNSARSNRGSAERQIHFNGADNYIKYHEKFSEKDVLSTMIGHLRSISNDIAFVETFGPNSDLNFKNLLREAEVNAIKNNMTADDAAVQAHKVETLYNYVAGNTAPIANITMARYADAARSWLSAINLGSALISSFGDLATMVNSARIHKIPALTLTQNTMKAMLSPGGEMHRFARRNGLALDTITHNINRYGTDAFFNGLSSRLSTFVIRAQGLNHWTEANRLGFTTSMMDAVGHLTTTSDWASLHAEDTKYLRAAGIDEAVFNILKLAKTEDWGGNSTLLTPEAVLAIPDSALSGYAKPELAKRDAALKLLGFLTEEGNIAITESGPRAQVFTHSMDMRGTIKGEIARSFWQFKSFPVAMQMKQWGRMMDQPGLGSKINYGVQHIVGSMLLGAVAVQMYEMANGREPMDTDNPKFWEKAILKGGGLGFYADLLYASQTSHGGSALGAMAGPLIGTIEQGVNLAWKAPLDAFSDDGRSTTEARAINFLRHSLMPGQSLWFARASLDHMIFHRLQDWASPGYLEKMKARAQREFKQRYWLDPKEATFLGAK